jgi:hypothetical protein
MSRRDGEAWRRANDASGLGCQLEVQAFQWTLDLLSATRAYRDQRGRVAAETIVETSSPKIRNQIAVRQTQQIRTARARNFPQTGKITPFGLHEDG